MKNILANMLNQANLSINIIKIQFFFRFMSLEEINDFAVTAAILDD